MKLSLFGTAFLKKEEGLRLTAYPDGKKADGSQNYSIGYGHAGASKGQTITRAQADAYFAQDVAKHEAAVTSAVSYASQQQFDALVAFSYNVGTVGMQNSTTVRLHNEGQLLAAANALRMWRNSDGAVNPVLVARRERERNLYLYGDPVVGPVAVQPSGDSAVWIAMAAAVGTYVLLPKLSVGRRVLAFG